MIKKINDLSAREFENMTFDLIQAAGFHRVTWRTPGADGGRDIEGTISSRDISGFLIQERWFIECKRHEKSIDWPTIWEKIAYADNQQADYLLLVTNSNPSPNCETEISQWNAGRRYPKVRVWRGYELGAILAQYAEVGTKYGLLPEISWPALNLQNLSLELTKVVQAVYCAAAFQNIEVHGLELAASVSELLNRRMADLSIYGRMVVQSSILKASPYPWLQSAISYPKIDEVGFRAIVCAMRYVTRAQTIEVTASANALVLNAVDPKYPVTETALKMIVQLGLWADAEITSVMGSPNSVLVIARNLQ